MSGSISISGEKGQGEGAIFKEVQWDRHWWVWVVMIGMIVVTWSFAYLQLVEGKPVGNNPAEDWLMMVILLFAGILFPFLILSARFTTVVRHDGLFIKYHPLHLKWRNIDLRTAIKVEAIAFSPLRDFGGWGIRFGSGGTAYTMNGDRGVRISYYRNQSIVIGSERPDELESAIRLVWKG